MASSAGRSLSYSRASADDDDQSEVTRSRSDDDRVQQHRDRMLPDSDAKQIYMNAASRERQKYD